MFAVTYLILLLFQKEGNLPNTRPYATAIGLLVIWVPTAIIHVVFVKGYSNLPYFVPPKERKRAVDEDEVADDREEDRPRPPRRREEDEEE